VDSSAVVGALDELGVDFETWSLGFGPEHLSELHYAQMVAQHRGVPMNIVEVGPPEFVEHLEEVVWHLDDPLCDCITVPNFILAGKAGSAADVLFNGEGGDPLFGGPKNKFLILGEWYRFLGGYDRVKSYLGSYHKAYDHLDDLFTPAFLAEVDGPASLEATVDPFLNDPEMTEFLNRLFHINIKMKGGHNILIKVDKMFSANGVQPRSPLFDKRLTELSFEVPCEYKRRGDVEKYILKRAVDPMLPEHVVYRRKAGMGVPLNHWFRTGALREHSMEMLSRERVLERGYFQPDFVERLFTGALPSHTFGRNRTGEILWMLLAVEQWHRLFVDGGWRDRMGGTP
jgi:asparagine synthase (glutamine-hydrolysing)